MQDFEKIYGDETRFLALTSLKPSEFDALAGFFAPVCEKYLEYHDVFGKKRKIRKFTEPKSSSLYGSRSKLFFILVYLKNNPLQGFIGAMFDISRGKVSQRVKILLPLLHDALKNSGCMPATTAEGLYRRLMAVADNEKIVLHDATERPVPRQTDRDNQKDEIPANKKNIPAKTRSPAAPIGTSISSAPPPKAKRTIKPCATAWNSVSRTLRPYSRILAI